MPILLFIFPDKSFLDPQLWTMNDSKLINKAVDLWIRRKPTGHYFESDEWECIEREDNTIFISNLSRNHWRKGVPDNEGYFTLKSYKEFLTASQAKKLEIIKG